MSLPGHAQALFIDAFDVSGDAGQVERCVVRRTPQPATRAGAAGVERIAGRASGALTFRPRFHDDADGVHAALAGLPVRDVGLALALGHTAGAPAAWGRAAQVDYNWTRTADGRLEGDVTALATRGVPFVWGRLLQPPVTHAAATAGPSIDDGVASADGLTAQLHLFAIDSGAATIEIQHSADGASWSALGAFPAASSPVSERIAVAGTVQRYLRVASTGTFSNAAFAVVVRRGHPTDDPTWE
jgi:hypothetical protein